VHPLPLAANIDNACPLKISKVPRDSRLIRFERSLEVANANFAIPHQVQQPQSILVGQRSEESDERFHAIHIRLDRYERNPQLAYAFPHMFDARQKMVAEFLGTFALVFAGTGAIIINDVSGGAVTHVGIALTFGLIVLAMIYTVGEISGAHLNPAVSVGFWLAGRFSASQLMPYVLSQTAGAIVASLCLKLLFTGHPTLGSTVPAGSDLQSFVLELILTFLLMFVILNVSTGAKEKGITAGIAVGAVIALEAMFAGKICGASMNPARSFAPALASGDLTHLWIYLTAPFAGAALAILACRGCQQPDCCPTRKYAL
jgi:aquaporin Z